MLTRSDLWDAELKLCEAAEAGGMLDLSRHTEDSGNVDQSGGWTSEHDIRADFLAAFLTSDLLFRGGSRRAVRLASARIIGALNLEAQDVLAPVELRGCRIDEQIRLNGARAPSVAFLGCRFTSISAEQLETRGDFVIAESRGNWIDLDQARIGGSVWASAAQLTGQGDDVALRADRIQVQGSVYFTNRFAAEGEIRMLGCHIKGALDLSSAQLKNPGGRAFSADRAQLDGGLFAREEFIAHGEVRLPGVHVTGPLDLSGATLSNAPERTLSAEGAHLIGGAFCRRIHSQGVVVLTSAHVSDQLTFVGARLENPGGRALIADEMRVEGNMLCETGFQAEGELRLLGASVTGHLSFGDAVLVNPHERSLDLEGVVVGTLVLPTDTAPDGVVDLTDASVTRLIDNWPVTQYSARLGGLTYDSLRPLPTDPAARLRWLVSAADGYLPHPYQQLILALRRAGRDDDARAVAIARERRRREELGIASRGWSLFLGVTVGYGYQAWRGIIWLAAFALAGWPIFAWARAHHHMNALRAPTEPLPQFHAWLYSLDSVLPVVNLGQKDYWSPTGIAQVWHAASVLAGWFLVTLILGALTTRLVRD